MNEVIESHAPARVCDLGGWTDTWFSGHGRVMSIAVSPGANCRVECAPCAPPRGNRVTLDARDFGERYSFDPADPPMRRHPLLEATVASMPIPAGKSVEVCVWSGLPPGCGTGTSAAVEVAMIGALDRLTAGALERDAVWRFAHGVETKRAGLESGVQDQVCATYGGVCFIEIDAYPDARVTRLPLGEETLAALECRLLLVYLGSGHDSSAIHGAVIDMLSEEGSGSRDLEMLRSIPPKARAALERGDLADYGRLMAENTEAQRSLHREIVSVEAQEVIGIAKGEGAAGWKVNGAGGTGGSVTLLAGGGPGDTRSLAKKVDALGGGIRCIPVRIDRVGLLVEGRPPGST